MLNAVKSIFLSSISLFVISACAPAPKMPIPTIPMLSTGISTTPAPPTPIPTIIHAPTNTASASPSPAAPTSTPTASTPFPAQGPYFAFLTEKQDGSVLTLLGADGLSRKELTLARTDQIGNCLECVLSPNGRWLAYWTGNAGDPNLSSGSMPLPGPYTLRLNLMHLPDGARTKITDLLSPDYPDIFTKNAEAIQNQPQFTGMDTSWLPSQLMYTFLSGIKSAAWSPDGRYLAFAGEMDGPSSDLYVYDTADGSIRRLSSGSTNIYGDSGSTVGWSPDGSWIVYTSNYVTTSTNIYMHATRPDGSEYRDFSEAGISFAGWISNSEFLTYWDDNGIGAFRLESGNLETGGTTVIWKCAFAQFAVDPQESALVYQASPGPAKWSDCGDTGLFLVMNSGASVRLLIGPEEAKKISQMVSINQPDWRFLYSLKSGGTFGVSATGKTSLLDPAGSMVYVSPDRRRVALPSNGLRMMDPYGKISDLLKDFHTETVFWQPDSQGLLFGYKGLNYLSMSDNSIMKLPGADYPYALDSVYWRPDSKSCFFLSGMKLEFLSLPEKKAFLVQTIPDRSHFFPVWLGA